MLNTLAYLPKTPSTTRIVSYTHDFRPSKSSPLAPTLTSSPGPPSPIVEAQTRRRLQFKSHSSSQAGSSTRSRRHVSLPSQTGASETPQASFLRERFKAKCVERARKARERSIQNRRWLSDTSSDGFDVDMDASSDYDDEEQELREFDDELFRRIMANERRKREHSYRLSYEIDVGSSFDPSMEDPAEWEKELNDIEEAPTPPEDIEFDDFDNWDAIYDEVLSEEQGQSTGIGTVVPRDLQNPPATQSAASHAPSGAPEQQSRVVDDFDMGCSMDI